MVAFVYLFVEILFFSLLFGILGFKMFHDDILGMIAFQVIVIVVAVIFLDSSYAGCLCTPSINLSAT